MLTCGLCLYFLKSEVLKRIKSVSKDNKTSSETAEQNKSGGVESGSLEEAPPPPPPRPDDDVAASSALKLELEMLQDRLRQRDSEIRILLRMMKQERKRADRAEASLSAAGGRIRPVSPVSPDRVSPLRLGRSVEGSVAPTPTPVSAAPASALGSEGSRGVDRTSVLQGVGEGNSLRGAEVAGGNDSGDGRGSRMAKTGVSVSTSSSSTDEGWKAALKAGE